MPVARRLLFAGEALLDVTTWIPAFPVPGSDTLAGAAALTAGGGFNVMAAAARQGIPVLYAGRHGSGPAGDVVRAALEVEGIEVLREVDRSADTGFVVTLVSPDGERTFVTSPAALPSFDAHAAAWPVAPGDFVYVSGYGLASAHGPELARWVGALDRRITVVADPGPLAADLPRRLVDVVLARADWWSCNRREAEALTGIDDLRAACLALAARSSDAVGGVVGRDGAAGCVLVRRTTAGPVVDRLGAPAVDVADTTGAGDTHVGVFVAGLATGRESVEAARRATVAAALSVTRRGPATAPGLDELDVWIQRNSPSAGPGRLRFMPSDATALDFRVAAPADVGAVVELVQSAYRGEVSRAGWTTEADLLDGVRTDAAAIGAVLADPRSVLLLAGRTAGSGGTSESLVACCHLRNDDGRAYFGLFAVRPDSQGGGIGRAVVAEARRRAVAAWGSGEMWMTVIRQRTELIAWYERLGFRRTGETQPFPYGELRFGVPKRADLEFVVLSGPLP